MPSVIGYVAPHDEQTSVPSDISVSLPFVSESIKLPLHRGQHSVSSIHRFIENCLHLVWYISTYLAKLADKPLHRRFDRVEKLLSPDN